MMIKANLYKFVLSFHGGYTGTKHRNCHTHVSYASRIFNITNITELSNDSSSDLEVALAINNESGLQL
jgi:hypothetical protein